MATTDGFVQVSADQGGKKVDSSDMTNAASVEVFRQRIALGDNINNAAIAQVNLSGELAVSAVDLLLEMKRQTALLTAIALQLASATGFNLNFDDFLES